MLEGEACCGKMTGAEMDVGLRAGWQGSSMTSLEGKSDSQYAAICVLTNFFTKDSHLILKTGLLCFLSHFFSIHFFKSMPDI